MMNPLIKWTRNAVHFFGFILIASLIFVSPAHSYATGRRRAGGISFRAPDAWQEVRPSSPIRLFQFDVPAAQSKTNLDKGELSIFYFGPGQGGSVEDNVNRWQDQFSALRDNSEPKVENEMVGEIKVTTVHVEGTFESGTPGQPTVAKKDYAVLGAIAQGPDSLVFFKMVGPRITIRSAEADFKKLIQSFRK